MALDRATSPTSEAAAAGSASTADLLEKIGNLNARLERAQTEIQDLQTSDRSWVKKAGLVIGVLAGLVAIPRTVKENWQALYNPPRTTIEWGKPLDLRYDVHDHCSSSTSRSWPTMKVLPTTRFRKSPRPYCRTVITR